MQLFAYNFSREIVSARRAAKRCDYICLECGGKVRIRSGAHRRPHFFHAEVSSSCRLSGKSMMHLQTQCYLEKILPTGDAALEWRFPEINRIADVVWFSKKIVFEVQCSPISNEEVHQRNRDYASLGYQVVWILHDSRYNQYRLSGAEMVLRASPHYFTDINVEGRGLIYDQFHVVLKGLRQAKLNRFPIDCAEPITPEPPPRPLRLLMQRSSFWTMGFKGDLMDRIQWDHDFLEQITVLENRYIPLPEKKAWWFKPIEMWNRWILRPFDIVLKIMLERACR